MESVFFIILVFCVVFFVLFVFVLCLLTNSACVSLDCLFLNVPSLFFGVFFFYLNNENFFYFSINLKQALCIQIQYVN